MSDITFEIGENLKLKSKLPKGVLGKGATELLHSVASKSIARQTFLLRIDTTLSNTEEYCFKEREREHLDELIELAIKKAEELGITDARQYLPPKDLIAIRRTTPKTGDKYNIELKYPSGNTDFSTGAMIINLPPGMNFFDEAAEYMVFHEMGHVFTKNVIGSNPSFPPFGTVKAWGNERLTVPKIREGLQDRRGFGNESIATLFALYCKNDDKIVWETSYLHEIALLIVVINHYATSFKTDPFEAFKKIFTGFSTRDVSLQKELVEIFGTETVRAMNNVKHMESSGIIHPSRIGEIAGLSGLTDEYLNNLSLIQGDGLKLRQYIPGLRGTIKQPQPLI